MSAHRRKWEADQKTTLPHVGTIQDFGTCISHKIAIIRKVVYEGKDPLGVRLMRPSTRNVQSTAT
ncbi:MAG: DUF1670 domain-containing protein [Acidobacteria bacterium]|nr:DUF1670 domain-containing protein [Acidobacteriota bacterium]